MVDTTDQPNITFDIDDGLSIYLPAPTGNIGASLWDDRAGDAALLAIEQELEPGEVALVQSVYSEDDPRRQDPETAIKLLLIFSQEDGIQDLEEALIVKLSSHHADAHVVTYEIDEWNTRMLRQRGEL